MTLRSMRKSKGQRKAGAEVKLGQNKIESTKAGISGANGKPSNTTGYFQERRNARRNRSKKITEKGKTRNAKSGRNKKAKRQKRQKCSA